MSTLISLAGIDEAISNLQYRNEKTLKYRLIHCIRAYYRDGESVESITGIEADALVTVLWDAGNDPRIIKNRRKNLNVLRSSLNSDLKKLYEEGKNSEGITIDSANVFVMSAEARDRVLSSFSYAGEEKNSFSIGQIIKVLKTVNELLMEDENDSGKEESDYRKKLDQLREMLRTTSEEIILGEVVRREDNFVAEEGQGIVGGTTETGGDQESLEVVNETHDIDVVKEEPSEDIENIEAVDVIEEEDGPIDPPLDDREEDDLAEGEFEEVAEEITIAEEDLEEAQFVDGPEEDIEDDDTVEVDIEPFDDEADIEVLQEIDEIDEEEEEEEPPKNIEDLEDMDIIEEEDGLRQDITDDLGKEDAFDDVLEGYTREVSPPGDPEDIEILVDKPEEELIEEIVIDDDLQAEGETGDLDEVDFDETSEGVMPDDSDREEDILGKEDDIKDARRLAEEFDSYLAEIDRFYNRYMNVPKGVYLVGCKRPKSDERESHRVNLPSFLMGKFPITNALFEIFVEKTGYRTTAERLGWGMVFHGRYHKNIDQETGLETFEWNSSLISKPVEGAFWYQPSGPGSNLHNKRNHPVVQVSIEDAMAFAAWTGKRLPTEDEWEAGSRTSAGLVFPWGKRWRRESCNIENSCIGDTTPVDQFLHAENSLGIVDTLGNVLEWTIDRMKACRDARGRSDLYIAKGGSWISGDGVRLYNRFELEPETRSNTLGFRCVAY